jgi:cyclic beta-1,2-glucan synthetase
MLPPDNFQEDPQPVIAHRTSPTNIGIYLLSRSAPAISAGRARSRRSSGWRRRSRRMAGSSASAATSTTGTTPRICGPLEPRYVSTVDSGNLAAHLIALANAAENGSTRAPRRVDSRAGVLDTLNLTAQPWTR